MHHLSKSTPTCISNKRKGYKTKMFKYDKLVTDMIKNSINVVKLEIKNAHTCSSTQIEFSLNKDLRGQLREAI